MGDPLGYKWFRELKQGKYRVYFYIYKNEIVILLLDTFDKKTQKEVISKIKKYLKELRKIYISD
jgi:putative component of toxin-antitoxin plasmid stabilization module